MLDNFNLPLNLRLILNCPICQREYQPNAVQVLKESDFSWLTYITCHTCGAHLLTKFASLPQGVVGNAILTDLNPEEVIDFAQRAIIEADDVLAVHELINKQEFFKQIRLEQ